MNLALAVEALWAHCALQTSSQHSKSLTSNQNISPVKFRRAVAPWGQKVLWMSPGKMVSRGGAESRWKEGIFLGIFGGGVGANDYAIGTPHGVEPARAIKLLPEGIFYDIL